MSATGKFSNEGNARMLSNMLNIGSPTIPTTIYMGLLSVVPDEDDTLATLTEISDTGYERQEVTFTTPSEVSDKMSTHNDGDVVFGAFDTGGLQIKATFITDAASGTSGTFIGYCDLDATYYTNAGYEITVPDATGLLVAND